MSIAIIGGNECMERKYKDLCEDHNHKVKVFTKSKGIKDKIGTPDVVILFTNTVSHKMIRIAMSAIAGTKAEVVRSHSSSVSSLKGILSQVTV